MSKEAMKLALEAAYLAGWNASGEGYNAEYPFGDHAKNPEEDVVWIKDRDNAIRDALAEQPAQQEDPCPGCRKGGVCRTPKCGRLKLPADHPYRTEQPVPVAEPHEQQEPYPVEEMQDEILRLSEIIITNAFYQAGHADALEWAAQMAVLEDPRTSDWVYDDRHDLAKALRKGRNFPSPPPIEATPLASQRSVKPWVGLTDEEKRQIFEREDYQGWLDYINAIEAKLKEKNQ